MPGASEYATDPGDSFVSTVSGELLIAPLSCLGCDRNCSCSPEIGVWGREEGVLENHALDSMVSHSLHLTSKTQPQTNTRSGTTFSRPYAGALS